LTTHTNNNDYHRLQHMTHSKLQYRQQLHNVNWYASDISRYKSTAQHENKHEAH